MNNIVVTASVAVAISQTRGGMAINLIAIVLRTLINAAVCFSASHFEECRRTEIATANGLRVMATEAVPNGTARRK